MSINTAKFELTDETMNWNIITRKPVSSKAQIKEPSEIVTLRRIRALKEFTLSDGTRIMPGDLGGWVESEEILSQKGRCWIADNSIAARYTYITGDALLKESSTAIDSGIYDKAVISGGSAVINARMDGSSRISEGSVAAGEINMHDSSEIRGGSAIQASIEMYGRSLINGSCRLSWSDIYAYSPRWNIVMVDEELLSQKDALEYMQSPCSRAFSDRSMTVPSSLGEVAGSLRMGENKKYYAYNPSERTLLEIDSHKKQILKHLIFHPDNIAFQHSADWDNTVKVQLGKPSASEISDSIPVMEKSGFSSAIVSRKDIAEDIFSIPNILSIEKLLAEELRDFHNTSENKKYGFTGEFYETAGHTLFRIYALKEFQTVDASIINEGELGGWIESEENLSQEGSCWADKDSYIAGDINLTGNDLVKKLYAMSHAEYTDSRQFNNTIAGTISTLQIKDFMHVFNPANPDHIKVLSQMAECLEEASGKIANAQINVKAIDHASEK